MAFWMGFRWSEVQILSPRPKSSIKTNSCGLAFVPFTCPVSTEGRFSTILCPEVALVRPHEPSRSPPWCPGSRVPRAPAHSPIRRVAWRPSVLWHGCRGSGHPPARLVPQAVARWTRTRSLSTAAHLWLRKGTEFRPGDAGGESGRGALTAPESGRKRSASQSSGEPRASRRNVSRKG